MSQPQKKSSAAIAENVMSADQAGKMSVKKIRSTIVLGIKKGVEGVFSLTTDIPMSIGQKSVSSLPYQNKSDMVMQIVSINQLIHKGTAIPVVTYIGSMTNEAKKIIAELAPTCASIRGGYFPGYATLFETKTQVGDITAPTHFKNVIALNKKGVLLFSVGKMLKEISVSAFLKQDWSSAKVVCQLNSEILFIGRPTEDEKNVFVVTESSILTVDISSYKAKEIKAQPQAITLKAVALFKDGETFVSVLNNGSLEMSSTLAA